MNVFVLNTGRCGSTTFIRACEHITNYSSGHETRSGLIGTDRFQYPSNHIEADNRLSWMLGRLEMHYGNDAAYVHLQRNTQATAKSLARRYDNQYSIIKAYREQILIGMDKSNSPMSVCLDYCETVTRNIEQFLSNKSRVMSFQLENARQDFVAFWEFVSAEGDLEAALREFEIAHNASKPYNPSRVQPSKPLRRIAKRTIRWVSGLLTQRNGSVRE